MAPRGHGRPRRDVSCPRQAERILRDMEHSEFVDANGVEWRVFAGLPADYPDTGDRDGDRLAGLTFRSSTGEVRVLPRAATPRRGIVPGVLPTSGGRAPAARAEAPGWEELLRAALVWPPA